MPPLQSNTVPVQIFSEEAPLVIPLGEVTPQARFLVGEKAFRLARLTRAGFQVPNGYCITVSGHKRHLARRHDHSTLPGDLREEILRIHRNLNLTTVAVRSSGLDEDLQEASAAGIYPTHLNIRKESDLLRAVADCLNAAACEQARRYRSLHRHEDPTFMAVLVQAQVEASSAGVLFTADPVTGDSDAIHVNAILGLGEPLTSGELTPDHYVQNRRGELLRQTIAPQPWMYTLEGRQPVAEPLQKRSALNPLQLSQLNQLAQRIEQHERAPVDIEFAFDAAGLHVLQARPITCAPIDGNRKVEAYLTREKDALREKFGAMREEGRIRQANSILSNGNIAELLPSPTPMSFELFNQIFAGPNGAIAKGRQQLGYQVPGDVCDGLFHLVAGQPFFLLEVDAQTFNIGVEQPVARIHDAVREEPGLANYPELGLYEQLPHEEQALRHYSREEAIHRVRAHADFNRLQRRNAATLDDRAMAIMEKRWQAYLSHHQAVRPSDLSIPQLSRRFHELVKHLQQDTCKEFVRVARLGFYFYDLCRIRLSALESEEQTGYLTTLFQGLQRTPISAQRDDLEKVRQGSLTLSDYLQRYGHLATNELEVSLPRYREDPEPLHELLRARGDHPDHCRQTQKEERLRSEGSLRADHFSDDRHADFWKDLRLAQRFLPLRERIKFFFLGEYALVRATLLELESRLRLDDGDIFYLRPQEIDSCSQAPGEWRMAIEQRRQDRRISATLAGQHRIPAVLFEDNLQVLGARHQLSPSGSWRGQAVSPGYIEGTARVVGTMEEAGNLKMEMGPDQILVIPSLNLGLSALLGNLGGLIVETGGLLAHSACQARERGIPAAVLPGATERLQNGDRIRLDGANGLIQMA